MKIRGDDLRRRSRIHVDPPSLPLNFPHYPSSTMPITPGSKGRVLLAYSGGLGKSPSPSHSPHSHPQFRHLVHPRLAD